MKKPNREKKPIKPIKILKKTGRFGFGFISLKPKKPNRTEPKQKKTKLNQQKTKPKPSQIGKNQAKPKN